MQTGSAGGSVFYSFSDAIESFKFVNGNGELIEAKRGTDVFNAAGVSMGLMGVITEVILKVRKTYTVGASEEVKEEKDSWLARNQHGKYSLEEQLQKFQYLHLNWFPHKYVRRVLQFTETRMPPFKKDEKPIPYHNVLGNWFASEAAAEIFKMVDEIRRKPHISEIDLMRVAHYFKKFVELTKEPTPYRDNWEQLLPTENDVPVDGKMRTSFTEIWFPVEQTTRLMDELNAIYADPRIALGNYAVEIYGAAASPFWLSPAYGRNVVRFDPLWWTQNKDNPADFFQNFFNKLLDIPGARLHWGKYLPPIEENGKFNLDFLRKCYPQMDAWLKIRDEMDPRQVFLTDYWRKFFRIQPTSQLQNISLPSLRP